MAERIIEKEYRIPREGFPTSRRHQTAYMYGVKSALAGWTHREVYKDRGFQNAWDRGYEAAASGRVTVTTTEAPDE